MSRPKTIGLAIVARLEEIEELAGNVVYYQTRTIEAEFTRRMGKARGKCVVVRLLSAPQLAEGGRKVRRGGNYTVTLFASPLLTAKDMKDSDALMQEIDDKLHGWWPEEVPSNGMDYLAAGEAAFPDDSDYEVTVIPVATSTNAKK